MLLHQEKIDSYGSRLDDAMVVSVNVNVMGLLLKDLQEINEMLHQHGSRVLRSCLILFSYRSASLARIARGYLSIQGVFLVARGEGNWSIKCDHSRKI